MRRGGLARRAGFFRAEAFLFDFGAFFDVFGRRPPAAFRRRAGAFFVFGRDLAMAELYISMEYSHGRSATPSMIIGYRACP